MNIAIEPVVTYLRRRVLSLRKGPTYFLSGLVIGAAIAIFLPLNTLQKPQVYFSPADSIDQKLIREIAQARQSIDIAIYSFTLPSIAKSLIEAHQRGVKIRVLFDKTQAGSSSIDELLEANGIALLRDRKSGSQHNKFMIIDSKIVFTGSYNFTANATHRNRENSIEVSDQTVVMKFQDEFEKLWATSEKEKNR